VKIHGIDGMTHEQLQLELQTGSRFVLFQYTISILVMTFRRPSDIYLVRPGESTLSKSIGFTLLTLVAGWWGIPWGPIYTIGSVVTNVRGGKDVTAEVRSSLGV